MFIETLKDDDEVVGIVCRGKLTAEDMKRMHVLLHEKLVSAERPGLVVDLTEFKGYEDADALREDIGQAAMTADGLGGSSDNCSGGN